MSMLSAQCDELRKAAQTCRDLGRYETEQMLLDAADTILSLRDKTLTLSKPRAPSCGSWSRKCECVWRTSVSAATNGAMHAT